MFSSWAEFLLLFLKPEAFQKIVCDTFARALNTQARTVLATKHRCLPMFPHTPGPRPLLYPIRAQKRARASAFDRTLVRMVPEGHPEEQITATCSHFPFQTLSTRV